MRTCENGKGIQTFRMNGPWVTRAVYQVVTLIKFPGTEGLETNVMEGNGGRETHKLKQDFSMVTLKEEVNGLFQDGDMNFSGTASLISRSIYIWFCFAFPACYRVNCTLFKIHYIEALTKKNNNQEYQDYLNTTSFRMRINDWTIRKYH